MTTILVIIIYLTRIVVNTILKSCHIKCKNLLYIIGIIAYDTIIRVIML